MLRTIAIIFGILFLIAGVLGFYPAYSPDGQLLGYFMINPMHNLVHIITGIVALWVGFTSAHASKIFFKVFGVIYVLVALLGLYYGEHAIFGLIANNMADVGLHFVVGIIALFLGFGCCCSSSCKTG
jgi:uncharacterized membrane protein YtjA (UPF0391 family)